MNDELRIRAAQIGNRMLTATRDVDQLVTDAYALGYRDGLAAPRPGDTVKAEQGPVIDLRDRHHRSGQVEPSKAVHPTSQSGPTPDDDQ